MFLVSITRPVVGAILSLIGSVLSIAALVTKEWYIIHMGSTELTIGLRNAEVSQGSQSYSIDVCNQYLQVATAVPCVAGKTSLGLGGTAVAAIGLAAVFAIVIACNRRLSGLWGGALVCNLIGGVLALSSGVYYIARMADWGLSIGLEDSSQPAQVGPMLIIVGGVLALVSSGLFCSCCCRPATRLSADMMAMTAVHVQQQQQMQYQPPQHYAQQQQHYAQQPQQYASQPPQQYYAQQPQAQGMAHVQAFHSQPPPAHQQGYVQMPQQ